MVSARGVLCTLVLLVAAVRAAEESSLEECLKKDSVSCVRDEIFRSLKSYLGQGSVEFLEEVFTDKGSVHGQEVFADKGSVVGSEVREVSSRGFLTTKDPRARRDVRVDGGVEEGSLGLSSGSDISDLSGVSDEGRGKKLKKLLPFLIMVKIQYFIYGVIAYVIVALVTKAALLKSSLALLIAGVLVLRRLLHPHHHVLTRHEVQVSSPHHHQEQHAEYSQNMAYRGQSPMAGRR